MREERAGAHAQRVSTGGRGGAAGLNRRPPSAPEPPTGGGRPNGYGGRWRAAAAGSHTARSTCRPAPAVGVPGLGQGLARLRARAQAAAAAAHHWRRFSSSMIAATSGSASLRLFRASGKTASMAARLVVHPFCAAAWVMGFEAGRGALAVLGAGPGSHDGGAWAGDAKGAPGWAQAHLAKSRAHVAACAPEPALQRLHASAAHPRPACKFVTTPGPPSRRSPAKPIDCSAPCAPARLCKHQRAASKSAPRVPSEAPRCPVAAAAAAACSLRRLPPTAAGSSHHAALPRRAELPHAAGVRHHHGAAHPHRRHPRGRREPGRVGCPPPGLLLHARAACRCRCRRVACLPSCRPAADAPCRCITVAPTRPARLRGQPAAPAGEGHQRLRDRDQ